MRVKGLCNRVVTLGKTLILGVILGLLSSCQPDTTAQSGVFDILFPSVAYDFRKVNLGMVQDSLKLKEPSKPSHEDLLGLSFDFETDAPKTEIHVEYYYPEGREDDRLQSILANIRFEDPLQCELLYQNCQRLFNRRYGPPVKGTYGEESWQQARAEGLLEAHLRLSESQTALSINILVVSNQSFQ